MDTKPPVDHKTIRKTITLDADIVDYVDAALASDRPLTKKKLLNNLLRKGIQIDSKLGEQTT